MLALNPATAALTGSAWGERRPPTRRWPTTRPTMPAPTTRTTTKRSRPIGCQASIKRGPGRPPVATERPTLNMRVDADVLSAIKAAGPGWQTRITALLRDAVARGVMAG